MPEQQKKQRKVSPLAEVEMEVLEEGREWMKERMRRKLQKQAGQEGRISPPQRAGDRAQPPVSDLFEDMLRRDRD
jgi:hypothetical protein